MEQVLEIGLHAGAFLLGVEEADGIEPADEAIEKSVDLAPSAMRPAFDALFLGQLRQGPATPFIGHQEHALREVERAEGRVDRNRDYRAGAHDVGAFEPCAFGAEEHADALADGDHLAGFFHRAFGGEHALGHRPVTGGGGVDHREVGAGGSGGLVDAEPVDHRGGSAARSRLGARIGRAVDRGLTRRRRSRPKFHRAGRGADVLADLRPDENEDRLRGPPVASRLP